MHVLIWNNFAIFSTYSQNSYVHLEFDAAIYKRNNTKKKLHVSLHTKIDTLSKKNKELQEYCSHVWK